MKTTRTENKRKRGIPRAATEPPQITEGLFSPSSFKKTKTKKNKTLNELLQKKQREGAVI